MYWVAIIMHFCATTNNCLDNVEVDMHWQSRVSCELDKDIVGKMFVVGGKPLPSTFIKCVEKHL